MRKRDARAVRSGALALIPLALLASGCSIRALAVSALGNALASGGQTYARDDDPKLVESAIPFGLKTIEALIDQAPKHAGLLLAAASGFTQYAYAFVQEDADESESSNLAVATRDRARARALFVRARNYGLRGLEVRRPNFGTRLFKDPKSAVLELNRADVPFMYWTAAAWGSAIGLSKDQPEALGELSSVEVLIDRALELDEDFDHGAIHVILISYELARPPMGPDRFTRARQHFDRAVELSGGTLAAPYVALAEAVSVARADRAEFESLLDKALAIDPNRAPDVRLANLVSQRRARWLRTRVDELFF